jgi:hypothetical protein
MIGDISISPVEMASARWRHAMEGYRDHAAYRH